MFITVLNTEIVYISVMEKLHEKVVLVDLTKIRELYSRGGNGEKILKAVKKSKIIHEDVKYSVIFMTV